MGVRLSAKTAMGSTAVVKCWGRVLGVEYIIWFSRYAACCSFALAQCHLLNSTPPASLSAHSQPRVYSPLYPLSSFFFNFILFSSCLNHPPTHLPPGSIRFALIYIILFSRLLHFIITPPCLPILSLSSHTPYRLLIYFFSKSSAQHVGGRHLAFSFLVFFLLVLGIERRTRELVSIS